MNDTLYTVCILAIWTSCCIATALIGQPGIYVAAVVGTAIVSIMKGSLA